MVQGVIFDMDGLMFDTERLWDTLWEPTCREMGVAMPADADAFLASGRGLAGQALAEHIREYFPTVDPQKMLQTAWRLADELFAKGVPCKPGLFELLDVLEERGIPRIVASSSPRSMILQNLSTTGAGRYFAQVVCGADVEHSKPAPDIFLLAASRLGVDIRRCLVLEDSLNGLRAARASGAVSVMVPDLRPYGPEVAPYVDYLKQDLSQVIDLLDAAR